MEIRKLRGWLVRLFGLFHRKRREREFAEELESHLAFHIEDNLRAGLSPEEARRRALIKLGGVMLTQERYREQRGVQMLETLIQDLRFGLRMLRKNLGFSLIAILTLALGIGVNTALFSVVNAFLFKPLPVAEPERLVAVYNFDPNDLMGHVPLAFPDFADLRARNQVFDEMIGYTLVRLALERGAENQAIMGELVTGNYFATLGLRAARGRLFDANDDRTPGAHPLVVLNYGTWQRRFGGAANIVGQPVRLNGQVFTVIGVAPAGFNGLMRGLAAELWVPMQMTATLRASDRERLTNRDIRWLSVMGRLQPGVTMAQAQSNLEMLGRQLSAEFPATNKDRAIRAVAAAQIRLLPGVDKILYAVSGVLMGLVGMVLLIACANVANLLLAQATARRKELAVRMALGAGRWRLVRQLLTESVLLALLGSALGLFAAAQSNRLLTNLLNSGALPLPVQLDLVQLDLGLSLDWRVFGFALLAALGTVLFFGLAPALQASRTQLTAALKEEAGTTTGTLAKGRLRSALVVAQVTLSLVLLLVAGLFLRSLQQAGNIALGFEPRGVVTAAFDLSLTGYSPEQGENFYRQLRARARSLPGVEAVGFASHLPLTFEIRTTDAAAEGRDTAPPNEWPKVDRATVGPGYFEAMGIPLLRGRAFAEHDTPQSTPVAVVNETLAQQFWPGQDALGKRLRASGHKDYYEVIGVVRTAKYRTLSEEPRPFLYEPLTQAYRPSQTVLARVAGDPRQMLMALRAEAQQLDANVTIISLRTLEEATSASMLLPRAGAALFGLFGALGLLLAVTGIAAVMAYHVSQRTHEIGIRLALGAQPRDILALVVRQGMRLVVIGTVLGLGLAALLTRFLAAGLYGVSPLDPFAFIGVPLMLGGVALLACYWPARRATKVDPLTALRHE
jgi:macrolide transport system ATP-binding/permease protein